MTIFLCILCFVFGIITCKAWDKIVLFFIDIYWDIIK